MTNRVSNAWLATGVAVLAGLVSLGRILYSNHDALGNLVWAEDGLFPLCVKAHGMASCTFEPYAGYLLLLPRLVAGAVSVAPLEYLPLASNLGAALLASALAAIAVIVLRAGGTGLVAAALVAMLPVLIPLMNIEAINATASSYMVLPFVAALAVSFPPSGRYPTVAYAALLLLSQLTNPLTALLLIVVVVHWVRGRIPRRAGYVLGATLIVGFVAQAVAARLSATPRLIEWSAQSARDWAGDLPDALLSFIPGKSELSVNGSLQSSLTTGWGPAVGSLIAAVALVGGMVLLVRRSSPANGIGMLLLFGLFVGIIPAAAGYANNRYFIPAALLWTAAGVLALDRWQRWPREVVVGVAAVVTIALCIPALPATDFRATATPPWPRMLDVARMTCFGNPQNTAAFTFSPGWPLPEVVYSGPTSNVVSCSVVGEP